MISSKVPTIHTPRTLHEALVLCEEIPQKQILAGATTGRKNSTSRFIDMAPTVISLDRITELKRINITDRYIEMGAMLTLNQIVKLKSNLLPDILRTAINKTGSLPIRNLATIGGNLCVPHARMDLYPVLHLLDARLELMSMKKKRSGRKTRQIRHIPLNVFYNEQTDLNLGSHEILTRVRIPVNQFDFVFFRKVENNHYSREIVSMAQVTQIQRDIITDFRLSMNNRSPSIFREREFEAEFLGRRLPMTEKEMAAMTDLFEKKAMAWLGDDHDLTLLSLKHMFIFILEKLNELVTMSI